MNKKDPKIVSFEKKRAEADDTAEWHSDAEDDEFALTIDEQMGLVRKLCDPNAMLQLKYKDMTLLVPFQDFSEAIEAKLKTGRAVVRTEQGMAEVIDLKAQSKGTKTRRRKETAILEQEAGLPSANKSSQYRMTNRMAKAVQLEYLKRDYSAAHAQLYAALMGW